MRKLFKSKKQQKYPPNSQSIVMMESNSLGMTVIQQDTTIDSVLLPLSSQQWVDIISSKKLDGYPYSRIYFSFLKGLPNYLRMKIWLFLVCHNASIESKCHINKNQDVQSFRNSREKLIKLNSNIYEELCSKIPQKKQYQQIEKDIHRSYSGRQKYKYTQPLLRKILYAISNWGIQYSQGMNYILLNVIIYCLKSLGLDQSLFCHLNVQLQKDIFVIQIGVILEMEETFGKNNIFKVIGKLQEKIAQSTPQILFLIYNLGMDCFSCFSQNYFSLMSYNDPPEQLCVYMMDLFFLEGQKAIHSMIVRMLQIAHDEILKINNPQDLQHFLKIQIFHVTYKTLAQEKQNANNISDFGMSFYQNVQQF